MGGLTVVIRVLFCVNFLFTIIGSIFCPAGDLYPCKTTWVDCTNLNITLHWESLDNDFYDVLYCDRSANNTNGQWLEVLGCKNISTNQCYLSAMIPEASLDNRIVFKVVSDKGSGNNSTECGLDFVPYSCAKPGAPEILPKTWTMKHKTEIYVAVAAPKTPYINADTNETYRLDDRHFALDYIDYVATLQPLASVQNQTITSSELFKKDIKGPQQSNEFKFINLEPATKYNIDVVAIIGKNQGTEKASVILETQHAESPVVLCPHDITAKVEPWVFRTPISWKEAAAKDFFGHELVPVTDKKSGSLFPIGNTRVTYVATDDADNVGQCSFMVIVHHKAIGTGWRIVLILLAVVSTIVLAFVVITKFELDKSRDKFKDINLVAYLRLAQRRLIRNRERSNLRNVELGETRFVVVEREVFDTPKDSSNGACCVTSNNYTPDPILAGDINDTLSGKDPVIERHGSEQVNDSDRYETSNQSRNCTTNRIVDNDQQETNSDANGDTIFSLGMNPDTYVIRTFVPEINQIDEEGTLLDRERTWSQTDRDAVR